MHNKTSDALFLFAFNITYKYASIQENVLNICSSKPKLQQSESVCLLNNERQKVFRKLVVSE